MRRHGAAAAAIVVGLMASACEPFAAGGASAGPSVGAAAAVSAGPSAAGSPAAEAMPSAATPRARSEAAASGGASPSATSSVDLLAGTPVVANCGPGQVRWTLTHLSGAADVAGQRPVARLTAINSSPTVCAFDGYPWFRVHVGKGPETIAQPSLERAQRLMLAPGRAVDTDLFYSETADNPNGCAMPAGERPQAQALPPGAAATATRIAVALTDDHGHPVPLAVCSDDIRMAAPTLR